MGLLYLNAASHGLPDRAVMRRMIAQLDLEAMIGTVAASGQIADDLTRVHDAAARLFNAPKDTVGFDSGTLSAWRAYVSELPMSGKRFLVAPHEWGENITTLRAMTEGTGARIEVLPPLDLDAPDLSVWQERMDDDVSALILPMVTSVGGLRYPVAAIGAMQRPSSAKVIVDAAQAIGQVEMDTAKLGCDAIFATTRKWVRGPRQTALFWVEDADRRAAVERFNTNEALCLGLGVALAQLEERGIEATAAILTARAMRIRENAATLGLACLGTERSGSAAVTVLIPADKAASVEGALSAADIIVKWPQPAKDEPHSGLDPGETRPVRIAPHVTTELSEINDVFAVIEGALS